MCFKSAAFRSWAVVLLSLIRCLLFLPLVCGGSVFGPCFVMHYLVSFMVLGSSWRGRGAGCFTLFVFLVSCSC